jgi:hypothetical protein
MGYRLKEKFPSFRVTREGEFAYHRFEHGKTYDKVPQEDQDKFEKILVEEPDAQKTKGGKK